MPVQLIDASELIVVKDCDLPDVTNGDPETTYTLRPLSVDDYRALQKAHTKRVINRRTQRDEDVIDYEALNDATFDFALQNWTGIVLRGQPVQCTTENKFRLDGARRRALVKLAGMNQIARAPEVRAESFRESPDVSRVLGGRETADRVLSVRD